MSMTKKEFINTVSKVSKSEMSKKEIGGILDAAFGTMKKVLKKGGKFIFPGFGIFSLRKRKARKGRNPRTGDEIKIKASKTITFKPSSTFKKTL